MNERIDTGSQNVTGYRKQTPEALELVNFVKGYEQRISVMFAAMVGSGVLLDPRCVSIARSKFEEAFMYANRAVFQPADPIGEAITRPERT